MDFTMEVPQLENYEKLTIIGQGAYGEVYKARNKQTNKIVAIKIILVKNPDDGFPTAAYREMQNLQVLKTLRNENIVQLLEIASDPDEQDKKTTGLVLEFCEHDLAGLIKSEIKFSHAEKKNIMLQLMKGLFFLHSNKILHRDLKPANILITKLGKLKITDFGLARATSEMLPCYTSQVVTLWYRSPELLLGEMCYGHSIDVWSAGCIMGELWCGQVMMPGTSEQTQLTLIAETCGSIDPEVWPDVIYTPLYSKIQLPHNRKRMLKEKFESCLKDELGLDVLEQLLAIDPAMRMDTTQALDHDFFHCEPLPKDFQTTLSSCCKSNL